MNTRGRKLAPLPYKPSTTWHLLHEEYFPIFIPERREQVEYWYNKTATGKQRETFRSICQEIYVQDPEKKDPEYVAQYSREFALCEVKMMIKHYGLTLSDLGKKLARVWILHEATRRKKDEFREVFTGAQTIFQPQSVMKEDYIMPDEDYYEEIDRTYFLSSTDWLNQGDKKRVKKLCPYMDAAKRLSLGLNKPRVTKPKNQFDGISPLSALGFDGANSDEIMEKLQRKLERNAESDHYYTVDGCTVYVAGGRKTANLNTANSIKGGVIATLCDD